MRSKPPARPLRRQPGTDALTGLSDRAALDDWLARSCAASALTAVILPDLDGFKTVDDTLGPLA